MSENELAPLGLFFQAMEEDKSREVTVGHAVDNDYEWFELKASNNLAELEKDGNVVQRMRALIESLKLNGSQRKGEQFDELKQDCNK